MRCKKHLPDLTSTIGVCASCLRERLQPLFAAQAQAQAQSGENASPHREPKHKPEEKPEALNFPRSASPYVARRKSDCDGHRESLFYGTPQAKSAAYDGCAAPEKRRHGGGRFWILSHIFRARSHKTEAARREPCEERSSPSWFTMMLPARHHKGAHTDRRGLRRPDRGLSPSTAVDFSGDAAHERSDSGNSTEVSPQRQNTTPATAHRRSRLSGGGGGAKGLSTSMAFCLSPLVRANPNQPWTNNNNNNNKGLGQEIGAGGPHHISSAATFCANRSRKLADFGRGAHNR
ncbi:hypothetical protein VNO80_01889 [Phaseolus coccineus]|uniref:Uncharacterized protein n=1 Tax=Phaseolus coccineus TaxID=3886 RepID=A0AAN9X018_PHACN